jgi:hypothetical protein
LATPKWSALSISQKGTENALLDLRQAKQVIKAPGSKEPGASPEQQRLVPGQEALFGQVH